MYLPVRLWQNNYTTFTLLWPKCKNGLTTTPKHLTQSTGIQNSSRPMPLDPRTSKYTALWVNPGTQHELAETGNETSRYLWPSNTHYLFEFHTEYWRQVLWPPVRCFTPKICFTSGTLRAVIHQRRIDDDNCCKALSIMQKEDAQKLYFQKMIKIKSPCFTGLSITDMRSFPYRRTFLHNISVSQKLRTTFKFSDGHYNWRTVEWINNNFYICRIVLQTLQKDIHNI